MVHLNLPSDIRLFTPLLLASIAPFANLAAQNLPELNLIYPTIITYCLILATVSVIIALLSYAILRHKFPLRLICNIQSVFTLSFFMFIEIQTLMVDMGLFRKLYSLSLWLLASSAVVWISYRAATRSNLTTLISVVIAAYMIVPLVKIAKFKSDLYKSAYLTSTSWANTVVFRDKQFKPNVYFFMLDQHVRHDVLEDIYQSSNSEFIDRLASKGFYIADQSLANYQATNYSLTSTFAMEYLFKPGVAYPDSLLAKFLDIPSGNNPVVASFRKSGYKFYLAEPPVSISNCIDIEDLCIKNSFGNLSELSTTILMKTPLLAITGGLMRAFPSLNFLDVTIYEASTPENVVASVQELDSEEPFFLFAHIFLPHAPYIFRKDCSSITVKELGNANHHTPYEGMDVDLWRSLYANQLHCTDQKMLAAVDAILEADSDAIIIVQSDHGTNSLNQLQPDNTPFASWSRRQFIESYGILNAIKLPARWRSDLYPTLSPVNTFRFIFKHLASPGIELLPDRSFYVHGGANPQPVVEWPDIENTGSL